MELGIEFKEIEALIKSKTGLDLAVVGVDTDEIRIQPRNMGFLQNRVKVRVRIDSTFKETNRLKLNVSAGVLSGMVVPKIFEALDFMPERSVARQNDGVLYLLLDKIPQLSTALSYLDVHEVWVNTDDNEVVVEATFTEQSGITIEEHTLLEDCWDESTSIKDRQAGNTMIGIARAIFESDRVDEGIQTLRDKATELKDAHGEELKEAALSWLKGKISQTGGRSTSDANEQTKD